MNIPIRVLLRAVVLLAMAALSRPAFGATRTYTAGGSSEFWSNPANWSGNAVPTSGDDVIIANAGTGTVRLNVTTTVNSITVQNGATLLIQAGQLLTVNNSSTVDAGGSLWLNSSNIDGPGSLVIDGTVEIFGGTLDGPGPLTIDSGGLLQFWGTVNSSRLMRDTNNSGTINFLDTIQAGNHFGCGGHINNFGIIDIQTDHDVNDEGGAPFVSNPSGGLIKKSAGSGSATINFHVNNGNGAMIEVDSGTLVLTGGGVAHGTYSISSGAALNLSSGTFAAAGSPAVIGPGTLILASGATLDISTGTFTMSGNPTVNDAGTLSFASGGSLTLSSGTLSLSSTATVITPTVIGSGLFSIFGTLYAGAGVDVTWADMNLFAGAISGPGAVRVSGNFNWSGGTITGSGLRVLNSTSNPRFNPDPPNCLLDGAALQLQASVVFDSSNAIVFSNGASLTIDPGKTLSITNDGDFTNGGGGGGSITNNGTIWKNTTAGLSQIDVPVTMSGTSTVDSGTLAFAGGGTHSGSFTVTAPATLSFSAGTHSMSGGGSISGTGTLSFSGATATVGIPVNNAGTLSVTAGTATLNATGSANAFTMNGGTLGGSGTLTLNNGGTWSGGTMNGSGTTINPATKSLSISAPVTLNSRILQNDGTLSVGGNVLGSGTIANNGTLNTVGNSTIGAVLNNSGQVTTSNALLLSGGGIHSGSFTVTAPGNLSFSGGTHSMSGGGSITGTGTLSFSGATATVGIPLSAGTLNVTAGTATLNANGSANAFTMNGGTLDGSGILTLNNGGTWSGGTMSGSGTTINPATKSLGISGVGLAINSRTLQNNGTLAFSAILGGSGVIDNQGTINGFGTIGAVLNNSGQVANSSSIDLVLTGGGTHTGSFSVTTPARLFFSSGTHSMSGGGSIGGTGTVSFSGATATVGIPVNVGTLNVTAGTATLNGNGSADAFTMSGGTLDGSGILTLNNGGTWAGGTMSGSGTTVNPTTKTLGISGLVTLNSRTLQNNGTLSFTGSISGSGLIDNQGTLNVIANSMIGAVLNNSGQVTTSNALALSGGGTHSGLFTVTAPGILSFLSGTHVMTAGGSIGGTGTLSFDGATATVGVPVNGVGTLSVTAGTATLNATGDANAFTMTGGTLGGSGTLTLNNGGTWSGGTMSGSGKTVNPATKILGISGSTALNSRTLQNTGTLSFTGNLSGSGVIDNQGTLNAIASGSIGAVLNNSGQVAASNALTLSGGGTHSGGSFTVTTPGTLSFSSGTHSMSGGGSIGGTGTLSFSGATATVGIPVNVSTLFVTAGTATLNANGSADAFTMNGGTLDGSGILTLNNGGTWAGGTMSGSGKTANPATKSLSISAPVTLNSRTLQNDGTLSVGGNVSGSGTIANNGTLNTTGNSIIAVAVNNSGQVATSTLLSLVGSGVHTGTFTANAPGVIDFSGGTQTISGTLAGTGTARFSGAAATVSGTWSGMTIEVAGGSVALNTSGTIPALTLSGGTLAGSGDVRVTGPSAWSGGTIAGSGAFSFDTGATVTMPGTNPVTLSRPLLNKGTINFTAAANGMLIAGVAVTNTGTLDIQSSQGIAVTPGTPAFVNTGTLKRSSGSGVMQFAAPVSNSGLVQVESGTMQFSGTYAQGAGTTNILPGATLQTATLSLNGGSLTGNGTVAGTVANHATVSPGASPGTMTVTGDYVQGPDGTLEIQLGGTTPGTQYDRLLVSGSVNLGGTLNVTTTNSFTPTAGNSFQIITFGSQLYNSFAVMNGLTASATVLVPAISASDFQLVTIGNQADLAVSVSAPASAANGSAFAYTVNVFNGGGVDANSVSVAATLPANATFTGATPPICTGAPNLVCSIGHLNNLSTATVVINVTASGAGAAPISVHTTAIEPDPNTSNNTASASSLITSLADVQAGVTGPGSTIAGTKVIYTVTVSNAGPDTAANVAVTATASPGLTFSGNSGACVGSFPCNIGPLSSGQHATIFTVWDVASSAAGAVQLTVNANSSTADANSSNNGASVTTSIGTCPTITILAPTELTTGAAAAASATPFGGAAYDWSITNGTIVSGAGTTGITFTPGTAGTTRLTVNVLGGGCTLSAAFNVTVKPPRTCVGAATPIGPADGTTTADATVAFAWSAIDGASGYRLWLQQGDAPARNLGTTLGTSRTDVIPPGVFRWYVETLFDGCASHESERRALTILPADDCASRGAPQLSAPSDDTAATGADVAFSWNAVDKALEYELWLAPAGGGPTLIRTTSDTSYTATVPPGRSEWYVRTVFAGCASTESAHRSFIYTPPLACGSQRPLLIAPAEGERLTSPVSFEWTNVPGATSYELYFDGVLAAATASTHASGIPVPLAEGRWQVRARFAEGCGALDSAESRLVVIPMPPSCSPLEAPVISAPEQISSGSTGRFQWSFVAGATAYIVEISGDPQFPLATTASSTVTTQQMPFTFTNQSGAPEARYVRVHALDTKCLQPGTGPFSTVAVLMVLPLTGSSGSALMTDPTDVQYPLSIGAELAGLSFTATPTLPWISVTPASGIVPPGGMTLHAVAHTAGLPPGTSTGSVAITTTAPAGKLSALGDTTTSSPISISNLASVVFGSKNTPPPDALIFPVMASVMKGIVRFSSDICVTNTSAQVMKYEIDFVPSGQAGISQGQKSTVQLDPGVTMAIANLVGTWLGGRSSTGTLEIRPVSVTNTSTSSASAGRFTFASSRASSATAAGGTGQYVPAVLYSNFVGKGSILSLQHIAQSGTYQTNLGLIEGSGEKVSLQVRIFDADGNIKASFPQDLTGGESMQMDSILKEKQVALDDGRIEVEVTSGNGKVTAYASVVDTSTNDSQLVPPVTLDNVGHKEWVLPGVGSGNWQTDVRIFNAGTKAADLTLAFYSMNGGPATTRTITLDPGKVQAFDQVLSSFFNISGEDAGALHISSATPAQVVATARTYKQTDNGAYGQFISAATPDEAVSAGSRPMQILQMEQSDNLRSNVGFAEVSGKPVTLEVSVFRPNSNTPAVSEVNLAPNQFLQMNSLIASLGLGETFNARISVRAISGEGRALAYGSLIDKKTSDPTYIPGQ